MKTDVFSTNDFISAILHWSDGWSKNMNGLLLETTPTG